MATGVGRGAGGISGGGFNFGGDGFGAPVTYNAGGGTSWLSSLNNFMGGKSFGNWMDLGGLALSGYGLNKSLGIAEDQLGILKDQEERAATAQNFATDNSLSLAAQMTTPGTAEYEAIKKAIETGQYAV